MGMAWLHRLKQPCVGGAQHGCFLTWLSSAPTIRPKRIVIVDDDGDLLGEACEFLLLSGYLVHSCQSPLEAMVIIQSNEVDVLISDIEMPEMDGTALAKWTNEQHGTVQVILVSGLDKPDGQIDNKWSFFRKPIDFAKVCSVIDAAT
ncbi:MAG: hypothetical protein RL268_744 [Pseudomonadota bacterium]|jgi:DNA-binding NtrC family response regulator